MLTRREEWEVPMGHVAQQYTRGLFQLPIVVKVYVTILGH